MSPMTPMKEKRRGEYQGKGMAGSELGMNRKWGMGFLGGARTEMAEAGCVGVVSKGSVCEKN
jgi:hypothetical protein